ncbi:sce7726 family protein [Acinetobacter pittii]|uniref:sce7726 family protein n=1 Tax=Acinetobacter pittii TaxID=48296 RepID=UPI0002E5212E|nr:sce7726 family protein [Acinetobacter pittii]MCU4331291.1 sce7726 family protein [Acinetobacter pittii]MDX8275807.1 sce7726 family protein [Acinetobacter pittii]SSP30565.1 Uncharacterised protein [Acinetobacter pittii]
MILEYKKLSKVFNSNILNDITKGDFSYIQEIAENFFPSQENELSLREIYDLSFQILSKQYPNEYVFKNFIANKIFLGKHSLNTATMLSEFHVGMNKADCVILNGKSICYEIKTDYDSLVRLEDQLNSYQQLFDEIYVVCAKKYENTILNEFPQNVGVITLTSRNTLKILRKASQREKSLNRDLLIGSMRQNEYKLLAEEIIGEKISLPNMLMFQECASIIHTYKDEEELNKKYIKILKKSRKNNGMFIEHLPNSLTNAAISYKFSKQELQTLIKYFNDMGSIKCTIQSLEENKMNF